MSYDMLVKRLYSCAANMCPCEEDVKEGCWDGMLNEAAEAIEKLQHNVETETNSRRFWHNAFLKEHEKVKSLYQLINSHIQPQPEPKTHLDAIKEMSVEDFVEATQRGCPTPHYPCSYATDGSENCISCWIKYLNSPLEVDNA